MWRLEPTRAGGHVIGALVPGANRPVGSRLPCRAGAPIQCLSDGGRKGLAILPPPHFNRHGNRLLERISCGAYPAFAALSAGAHRVCFREPSPLCPGSSDIHLLSNGKSVVNLDAEITHGALELGVTQQQLDGPKIACTTVDEGRLVRRSECVPKKLWSNPILDIQLETSRAY